MNKIFNSILSTIEMLLGTAMTAAAFGLVIIPQGFAAGGVTGFARIISNSFGISLSLTVMLFNIALLIIGWLTIGRAFIARTVAVSVLFPIMLELFSRYPLTSIAYDNLLCTFVAGALLGIGAGLILHSGASSGGFDILAVALNRKIKIPVALVMNFCDILVIVLQAINQPLPQTLYGVLVICITTYIVGKVVTYGTGEIQVLIFSKKYEDICDALLNNLDVGVTYLDGESGYEKIDLRILISVMPYEKVGPMKRIISRIDPKAFIVINEISSVLGRGYTIDRN